MPVYTFKCDLHNPPVVGDVLRDIGDVLPPRCPYIYTDGPAYNARPRLPNGSVVIGRAVPDASVAGGYLFRCDAVMKRVFTPFGFRREFPAHYNMAAGAYVSNPSDLREHYARKSAEDTERLGMEVRYAPLDADEQRAVSVTDAHLDKASGQLDDTHRKHRELGWTERRQMWL